MKPHWGRITVKTVFVLTYIGALSAFERFVGPTLAPQVAHVQLQDTVESSAAYSAYSWAFESAWALLALIVIVLVVTEVLDMRSEAKKKEG